VNARSIVYPGLLLFFAVSGLHGASFHLRRPFAMHSSGISLRKRLHVNDLIAEPGTAEIDWSSLYSYTTGLFSMPAAIKFTPAGDSFFWGRTEYSIAFDSISSEVNTGVRSTQFSDRLTIAATSVLFDSPHFDVAFAPQLTTLLRNDSGVRIGGTAIARYDGYGNSVGFTAGWSAATSVTDTNPAGVWDFGAGYGRHLGRSGVLDRTTLHANVTLEKSTGFERTVAVFGGVEYQISKRVAIDASGQRLGLSGPGQDRQVLLGFTVNLGKLQP
jgi:hypothetical protein